MIKQIIYLSLIASCFAIYNQVIPISYTDPKCPVAVKAPLDQVSTIREYAFAFWHRSSYFSPERVDIGKYREEWKSMAGISENGSWNPSGAPGDRTLAFYVWPFNNCENDQVKFHFTTYNLKNGNNNEYKAMDIDKLDWDATWNWYYFGYSLDEKRAFVYVKFGRTGKTQTIEWNDCTHTEPMKGLTFSVGEEGYVKTNGHAYDVKFLFEKGAYMKDAATLDAYMNSLQVLRPPPMTKKYTIIPLIDGILKLSASTPNSRKYGQQFFNLGGLEDYAIQGWSYFDDQPSEPDWYNLCRVTTNPPSIQGNLERWGDRQLTVFIYRNMQKIHPTNTVYHIKAGADNFNQYRIPELNQAKSIKKWFWIYYGYSYKLNKYVFYYQSGDAKITEVFEGSYNLAPDYLNVFLGSDGIHANWNGQMKNWFLRLGDGAFVDSDFEKHMNLVYQKPECAYFYTECDFKGEVLEVCENMPALEKEYKSFQLPEHKSIVYYAQSNYEGEKVEYKTSQTCISEKPISGAVRLQISKHTHLKMKKNM